MSSSTLEDAAMYLTTPNNRKAPEVPDSGTTTIESTNLNSALNYGKKNKSYKRMKESNFAEETNSFPTDYYQFDNIRPPSRKIADFDSIIARHKTNIRFLIRQNGVSLLKEYASFLLFFR